MTAALGLYRDLVAEIERHLEEEGWEVQYTTEPHICDCEWCDRDNEDEEEEGPDWWEGVAGERDGLRARAARLGLPGLLDACRNEAEVRRELHALLHKLEVQAMADWTPAGAVS